MDATLLPPAEAEDAHKTDRKSERRPRVELITRGERRRRWSIEQKQEIVAESLSPDTTPTEVARKHAVSSGLLYTWRHQLLAGQLSPATRPAPTFARVEIAGAPRQADPPAPTPMESTGSAATIPMPRLEGLIEIVLADGVTLRVDAQVDGRALRRVLAVLEGR
ncbi:MAG: transposase [Acetobacteraceae bacterium]|nr:transposase [Acetobacteraceae bacterium]MBV8573605.1 transposase [Acetobacteraceae bacterium]